MGFDAVFIGTGAGYPSFMGIPGESLNGVLSANELLTRCNLMHAGRISRLRHAVASGPKHIAVIGAGNTAMDAMRVCRRLGAENVHCVYRRTKTESPARAEETRPRRRRGHRVPLADRARWRFWATTRTTSAECAASAWNSASPTNQVGVGPSRSKNSEYEFEADMVVYAIGTNANPIIGQTSKLKLNKPGLHRRPTRIWPPRSPESTAAATSSPAVPR